MKVDTKKNRIVINSSIEEVVLLCNALNEICDGPNAIEDWEFHTRTGSTKAVARDLIGELEQPLEKMKHNFPKEYSGESSNE